MRDITIGQYYNAESVVHRMDTRTKLVITFVYALSLFYCREAVTFAVAAVWLGAYVALSKVPVRFMVKGLKPVWTIMVFTAVFGAISGSKDDTVLATFAGLAVTAESMRTAIMMIVRLVLLIMGSSIMTYTSMPLALTAGLEKGLGFLKYLRVPVAELAMMMTITLRFIPILTEEMDKIMKAQLSRGADFESGNIIKRIKAYVPVLLPLFVSAIKRSTELAYAMDARCFHGSSNRTHMTELAYGARDAVAYMCLAVYVGAIVALKLYL